MTKFHEALERGEPLVILLDFEMFDEAGAAQAKHRFSMNWYADTSGQYDDRLMDFGFQMRTLGDFGSSGLAEITDRTLRLAGSAELAVFREDFASADKTTLLARAASERLKESDLITLGLFEVVKTRDEDDGTLSVEFDTSDRILHQARVAVKTYLGLGQALDAAQSPAVIVYDTTKTEDDGDPRLDPIDALYIGAWVRLSAAPDPLAILSRRLIAPGSIDLALDWVIRSDLHPSVSLRSGSGQWITVEATDLEVPLSTWVFVELRWNQGSQTLDCRLNGTGTNFAAIVPGLAISTSRLTINEGSSIPGLLAEYRYATRSIDAAILDRRALRTLEDHETRDYVLYFTFDGEHLVDTRTAFDQSPEAMNGRADGDQDLVFAGSDTGTRELAAASIPRVIGLASHLEGQPISGDRLCWQFCQGPVRAFQKVATPDNSVLWLKISQVVEGELTPAAFHRAAGSSEDLSSYQRFQTVRITSGTIGALRVVNMAHHDVIYFQHSIGGSFSFDPNAVWSIETADPWERFVPFVEAIGASGTVTVQVFDEDEPLFRQARIGQRFVIGGTQTYTITSILGWPFDTVTVAEPIADQSVEFTVVSLLEYYDAIADLEAGIVRVTADPGGLFADVVAECEPTPRGVIEHLYGLVALPTVSLPELDAFRSDFGLSLAEETTVASLLQVAAGSLDGVVFPDLASGEIGFDVLSAPSEVGEIDFPEVVAVQRVDDVEAFEAIRIDYRQHGASAEWESVVVPQEGTTLRRDAPVLTTYFQDAASAGEQAEAIFELRKNGQEVYAVDVPLRYFRPDLPFRTVSLSGAGRLAGRTWRVIGLGITAPGLCRLLVWRNLS